MEVINAIDVILAAHPDSYKHHQCNLADHQRGTCTLRGIRRRLVLKVEGLARVSVLTVYFLKMGECREVLGGGPAPPSKL